MGKNVVNNPRKLQMAQLPQIKQYQARLANKARVDLREADNNLAAYNYLKGNTSSNKQSLYVVPALNKNQNKMQLMTQTAHADEFKSMAATEVR